MKKFLIIWFFLLFALVSSAQNDYFLFIQSENNQPYYVQTGGKTLSSSAIGHLIISGLKDSIYTLHIGFPKNLFHEQLFQIRINKKDAGYQLKNLGAEGWALFNIQTLQSTKPQQVEAKKQTISYGDIKKTDVFSTLMAGLVNDSAVLYTSIAKAEPVAVSSKTSFPDTTIAVNDIVKQEEANKKDRLIVKNETIKPVEKVTPDTPKIEVNREDTSKIMTGLPKQNDIAKKDTAIAKSEIVKQEKVMDSSIAKSDIAKKEEFQKKDTVITIKELAKEPLVVNDSKPVIDSLSKSRSITDSSTATRPSELKSLIIWFSETKTGKGTELVYFDMTAPDKIDTIRILIPQEETIPGKELKKDDKVDSSETKKEVQKSGAGKFIGKIFGKKNSTESKDSANKSQPESNEFTVKVTTVETVQNRKLTDSAVAKNKTKDDAGTGKVEINENQKETREQKNNSGNFLDKIFGKKNTAKPSAADSISKSRSAQNTSTVKVTTIENRKSSDSIVSAGRNDKSDESTAEVEKLKKDQEKAEKTSTERFFGKIFGKKKNDPRKDSAMKGEANQSSIKVTTIESTKRVDTTRTGDAKKKVAIVNSDCNDFATDDDIEKLKVKMLSKKSIDGQIVEAKKFFKTKCLSTKQVKALSTLYKTDADKYKLFDASYPFVSDSSNFMDLVVLLNEVYYINRFIAMVRM